MSPPFRLALVGAGLITQQSHLPAALASPMVEVSAIVDPVTERAVELARGYGIRPRIAARVEDVVMEIDGAIIATPNHTHRAIALACLERRIPTLIEKPLARSYSEGIDIVRTADANDTVVAVGYCLRFQDNVIHFKTLLDQGFFGEIKRFVHEFGTAGGWAPLSAYNLDRKNAGGGVLVVTGSHFLDRMLYFWGYPDHASLEDDGPNGPEANCTARFEYSSKGASFVGLARYSKTVRLPGGMVVETDRGFAVLTEDDNAEIVFRPHSNPAIEQIVRRRFQRMTNNGPSVFQLQLEDFIRAVRDRRRPVVDGRQALESLRLIDQLYANRRLVAMNYYQREKALARP